MAIDKYGFVGGLVLGAERLTRCFYTADGAKYFRIGPFYYDQPQGLFSSDRSMFSASSYECFVKSKFDKFLDSACYPVLNAVGDQPDQAASRPDSLLYLFSCKKMTDRDLSFACYLYQEKQFFRAATEFYRHLHHHPVDENVGTIWLLIACCNFQSGRYMDAAQLFDLTISLVPKDEIVVFAQFMKGLSYLNEGMYHHAQDVWDDLLASGSIKSSFFRSRILIAHSSVCLKQGDIKSAYVGLEKESDTDIAEQINMQIRDSSKGKKSSFKAALLSAVFPGTGQFYSGRYREGIYSIIVNGTLGFIFYDAYRNGSFAAKSMSGFFALQFYLGNIIGGKRAAEIHNEMQIDRAISKLQRMNELRVDFPLLERGESLFLVVN